MHLDVLDLRRFYTERALGRVVQRLLRDRVVQSWPAAGVSGMTLVGYGYAVPLLRPWLASARRVTALMPAPQGVLGWPTGAPNRAALCDETAWPLETGSVDRLLMLHGLEASDHPAALLAEAWRVLGPGGRMLVVVPNRTGLWARSEATPFGTGRSYTARQIDAQARAAGFVTERLSAALYIPPSDRRFWLRSAPLWEQAGARISRMLVAGLVLAEFSKQVQAPIHSGALVHVPSPLEVLGGLARPRPIRKPVARVPDAAADEATLPPAMR